MTTKNFLHNLRKSRNDRVLFGVCGGLGEVTSVPGWAWRIIFVILAFCFGTSILIYLLLALFMPNDI